MNPLEGAPGAKAVNVALQGGGSHGAFTWGVLDRLLEDQRIVIEAVTGASAGAMNAVVLAQGMATGCRDEARKMLQAFWRAVSEAGRGSLLHRSPLDVWRGTWNIDSSPAYLWFDLLSRLASPYDLNPLNINPLQELLEKLVDFETVRNGPLKVFVSATNVETGRARVFMREELRAEHVLASACLPFVFQAVEIEGAPYWDGGYMGNPPLWPLFDHCTSDDVIVVQINPLTHVGAPRSARDILNRLNEITFNASLLRELRAVDFVTRLLEEGRLEGTGYRRVFVHAIANEPKLAALGASSKLNSEWGFLTMLFETGRAAAGEWLDRNFDSLGARSSLDVHRFFQGEDDPLDGSRINRKAAYQASKRPRG